MTWLGRQHCRREQILTELEQTPDLSRGEARLAAEAALNEMARRPVPGFVLKRAVTTLRVLANG
jgi:hypothetical protein